MRSSLTFLAPTYWQGTPLFPLTSPKPKHLHMKNQIDFLKIKGGEWGAVNFNNMIPVHPGSLKKVEMKILETDSKQDISVIFFISLSFVAFYFGILCCFLNPASKNTLRRAA